MKKKLVTTLIATIMICALAGCSTDEIQIDSYNKESVTTESLIYTPDEEDTTKPAEAVDDSDKKTTNDNSIFKFGIKNTENVENSENGTEIDSTSEENNESNTNNEQDKSNVEE